MIRLRDRLLLAALCVWLLTGFYIVGGNEKAIVRRFGRQVAPLRMSGLHYDWPAPFTRIDRVNFAAVRTVVVGPSSLTSPGTGIDPARQPRTLLTGDQNLLQVRAQVQYRPSEAQIGEFLFGQVSADRTLAQLAESTLLELIARSGVDSAHASGIGELNELWTTRLRSAVSGHRLGLEIERAVIEQVDPPTRVKADFLDVSNARAEQARGVQEARTGAEQRISQARSEGQRQIESAEADRRSRVAAAEGAADRFRTLVAQMQTEAERQGTGYADVRRLMVQRLAWQTLAEVWPKVRKKTIVDASGPVDISIFPKTP